MYDDGTNIAQWIATTHRAANGIPAGLSVAQQQKAEKQLQQKQLCQKYIAAYRGEHKEFLGSDVPYCKSYYSLQPCIVLLSTQTSHLLGPLSRFRYRPFSQDQSIAICVGDMVYSTVARRAEFTTSAPFAIHSDQLDAPVARKYVRDVTPSSLRSALQDLIPPIANDDNAIAASLLALRTYSKKTGIQCIVLKLKKGQVWTHRPEGFDRPALPPGPARTEAATFSSLAPKAQYITIIRHAGSGCSKPGEELWDYLISRCRIYGVFWAYGQHGVESKDQKKIQQVKTVIHNVSMRAKVVRDNIPAPMVSWWSWKKDEWKNFVDNARKLEEERRWWALPQQQKDEEKARQKFLAHVRQMVANKRSKRNLG